MLPNQRPHQLGLPVGSWWNLRTYQDWGSFREYQREGEVEIGDPAIRAFQVILLDKPPFRLLLPSCPRPS